MATKHIANHERIYLAINSSPDVCKIHDDIVAFDIYQTLDNEKMAFSTNVFARKQPILLEGSVVRGVVGNAGEGVKSGVAISNGHIKVLEGCGNVFVQKRRVARHQDPIEMNGDV